MDSVKEISCLAKGNLAKDVRGTNVSTSTHLAFNATTPPLHVPAASPVKLRFFNKAAV